MYNLIVGVCHVHLHFRHARSLKDKRHFLSGVKTKLRNLGFSVTDCGYRDDVKQGSLGFSYVGATHSDVEKALDDGMRLFVGEFEVLRSDKDVFDYSELTGGDLPTNDEDV